jgi:uncharacterized membrane protein
MRRLNPHTWNAKVSAFSLTFALIVSASASFAQIANFERRAGAGGEKRSRSARRGQRRVSA